VNLLEVAERFRDVARDQRGYRGYLGYAPPHDSSVTLLLYPDNPAYMPQIVLVWAPSGRVLDLTYQHARRHFPMLPWRDVDLRPAVAFIDVVEA
jgi:hypothetical protein